MKKATKYVLRNQGTSRFATKLPHDFDEKNFVQGWENLSDRALCFDSEESAQVAADADPDGDSLTVEPIETEEDPEQFIKDHFIIITVGD